MMIDICDYMQFDRQVKVNEIKSFEVMPDRTD